MNKTIIAERFSKAISTYPREANVKGVCAMKFVCKSKRKCMTAYLFLFEDTVSI